MLPTKTPSSFFRQRPSRTLAMVSNGTGSYANDTRTEDSGEGLRERERQGGTAKGDKIVVRFMHIVHENSIERGIFAVGQAQHTSFLLRIMYLPKTRLPPAGVWQASG